MAIERTVGVLGQHAEWRAAWEWLIALGALANDYLFRQISDVVMAAGAWTNNLQLNGRTVEFRCPFADSHQGDPTRGFKTDFASDIPGIEIDMTNAVTGNGTFIIDGLYCERTTLNTGALGMLDMRDGRYGVTTLIARNLLMKGFLNVNRRDRLLNVGNDYVNNVQVYNCKLWNGSLGFGSNAWNGGVGARVERIVENIVIYNCNAGLNLQGGTDNLGYNFRNVVIIDSPINDYTGGVGWEATNDFKNCADSDGTLTVGDNIFNNIVAADEFKSLIMNADFLKLIDGTKTWM